MNIIYRIIFFFSIFGLANAQSKSDNERFSEKLFEQDSVLWKHSGNVLEMLQGSILDSEYRVGTFAYDRVEEFNAQISEVLKLSYIFEMMFDPRDKKSVKKYFIRSCQSAEKSGSKSIEQINFALVSIKPAALIEEMKQMRDDVSNLLKTLDFCNK